MAAEGFTDKQLAKCNVLLVNRPSRRESFELIRKAKQLKVPVILDIDDWMYAQPRYGGGKLQLADRKLLNEIYAHVDVMTVPTTFLSQVMTPLFDKPKVLVPYGVDFPAVASPSDIEAREKKILITSMFALKIGDSAAAFANALMQFLNENKDWSIDFLCENFNDSIFRHSNINIRKPVPYDQYLNILSSNNYRMCLAPLSSYEEEDELVFNACKSPVKFVDYSANSIPAIYSRTPVYQTVVRHGETGLFAENSQEDWHRRISELASDQELQTAIATQSYLFTKSRFTTSHAAASLKTAIEIAAGGVF